MSERTDVSHAPDTGGRAFDRFMSWILYALHLCGVALLSFFALIGVMMTDSCGGVAGDAAVCNVGYLGAVLFGYWGMLALSVVTIPIAIIVKTRKGRRSWTWVLTAMLTVAALTVLFVMLMTR